MDYTTLFVANIATMIVFTTTIMVLAWHNRSVTGMKWFAGALIVNLVKLILQALEGKVPVISAMVGNELYLISIVLQMVGLWWFVVRKPIKSRWPWIALVLVLATYSTLFLCRVRYSGNVINIPFVFVCGFSAWLLLKHGRGPFVVVSRVAAAMLGCEMMVAGYRAVLTNLRYMRPWETVHAQSDPRWQYSLAAMFFLITFMVMCQLWFLVTELQRELAVQARTDPLTGAFNRRALEEAAVRETSRSMRSGHPLCIVMMDIDRFKQLNDTWGHVAGDCVLQALVQRTKEILREQDLVARTGGEEFTILLPDTPVSAGIIVAERLRKAIEILEVPFATGILKFTVSMGVAQFNVVQDDWEGMLRRADMAMYEAKADGRNKVVPN